MARLPKVTAVVERSDILERRLANPFNTGSAEIPCKRRDRKNQPLYKFRIRNNEIHHSQAHRAIVGGWEYAQPEDIDGNVEDYGFTLKNGRLVSGPREQEVLIKIRASDFEQIQAAKAAKNSQSVKGLRGVVEQAGSEVGDEAASFLHRNLKTAEVTDTMEKIPADER